MPVQNLTVSWLDPFIIYDGPWILYDDFAMANGTASLSVAFYGTAIYLPGDSQRNYSIVLDGAAAVHYNNATRGSLFAQDQLTAAHHTLTVNAEEGMSLLSMVVTTGDGDSSTGIQAESRIENSDRNVTYPGIDQEDPTPGASNNDVLPLSSPVTYANISFHGNEIALYSWLEVNPPPGATVTFTTQSGYNVSVDGGPSESWPERGDNIELHLASDSPSAYPNTLLYQRSGLANGDHYVVLTVTSATSFIEFDYAVSRVYSQKDQSPIPTPSQPTSTPTVTNSVIGAPTSAPSTARSTNVAAIAGGVVGGVVLAFMLSTTMLFIIRRRYRQARLTFVGEDGLDGGGSTQPRRSEEDMPPPLYRRIFPSDSGAPGDQPQVERELPADAHRDTPVAGRIARKNRRAGASALDQAASRPSTGPTHTALDGAHSRAPIARAILDGSMWTWKGVRPPKQRNAVLETTNSPPGETGEK